MSSSSKDFRNDRSGVTDKVRTLATARPTKKPDTRKKVSKESSILAYKRAHKFAMKAGWPTDVPFSSSDVSWQIAPDDSVISALIEIRGPQVVAVLTMNYMGRTVQMVRLTFDGVNEQSEGLLFRGSVDKACFCFRSHLENMMHGPVKMSTGQQSRAIA